LRAASTIVENVGVGGGGRATNGIGEHHRVCTGLVLSQCHRPV
jgi:hypothetical protein